MFWRMAGLSTASPVETILDKDNFSLEELLDEDEIIQECKALNARLINFLRERPQVEQLVRYIVEEAPEDAEKSRNFKFPFISCEIFTCEIDIILRTLVEDEELLDLLFSFLDPNRPHSTLLAGYFSKVVTCLLVRKTVPLMNYIQAHREIIERMVDLIGITSIMEVMIRLVGADEHIYANYSEATKWLEDLDIIEMVVDKFSSSASPEVHSNAAEILCAIIRYAPSGLAARVSSPSFVGRLFKNALEESRPRSVLVNSLLVCICLLDPKRFAFGGYHAYTRQYAQGSSTTANPETVEGMLQNLGPLLKLLDVSSEGNVLLTTYGKLQPPLGRHRLKIVEFIAVLLSVGSEAVERELIQLGVVQRILDMFFEYPYNNFLHHHVETIVLSCLESKSSTLLEHILKDCNLIWKILEADKNSTLATDTTKPTVPFDGKQPPRLGNIGHITRISNKLVHLGNTRSEIQIILQENNEWVEWSSAILSKRNAVENVYQWACGRPTALHDRTKDSDDEDYQERDYDVAALANNLSQAFRYGIYSNELEEGHGSLERDDEDVYFDDESAEVVISSLRLGDDQEGGSLFTNSNWFAFEDGKITNDRSMDAITSALSGSADETRAVTGVMDEPDATTGGYDELDGATSSQEPKMKSDPTSGAECSSAGTKIADAAVTDEPPEWVEWRETSSASEEPEAKFNPSSLENASKSTGSEAETTKCEVSNDLPPATTDLSPYPDDPPVSDPSLKVGKTATTEGLIADAHNQSMLSASDANIPVKDRSETSSAQHVLDNEKTETAGNVAEEAKEM